MNIRKLKEALGTNNKIVKDECGDLNIFGKKGKIYSDEKYGDYWYLFIITPQWNQIKLKLSFMEVHQDCDGEGVLKLNRMPNPREASKIRKVLGLGKKRILSEEHKEKLMEGSKNRRFRNGTQI